MMVVGNCYSVYSGRVIVAEQCEIYESLFTALYRTVCYKMSSMT